MKKLMALLLAALIFAGGLSACTKRDNEKQKFSETFIDYFNTVITIVGYEESVEKFDETSDEIEKLLRKYHELYDIYNSYSGVNNIYTVNKNAGVEPVTVDNKIIDLIDFAKEMYETTSGKTDITKGALLKLWHDARETASLDPDAAYLPSEDKLSDAAELCGFDKVVIDREKNTVFITQKGFSLDVGAVAKGYTAEQIALYLEDKAVSGYALNLGGNIRVVGDKPSGDKWTASIADPWDQSNPGTNVIMAKSSFVTSGSYQRYFEFKGVRYHHIINPDTNYPSNEFVSVSVMADDSGVADCLSTALFSMTLEEGKALVKKLSGVEAVWITNDKKADYTDGFEKYIIEE